MNKDFPSVLEAEKAVRTLIKWLGDNPERYGLNNTPERVISTLKQIFSGYMINPHEILLKPMINEGYEDIIILRDIKFISYCEHHLLPMIGSINIAYLPDQWLVGVGKLVKLVECLSKRLQIQERLTIEIANIISTALSPKGVGVTIEATHYCICKDNMRILENKMFTKHVLGVFRTDLELERKLMQLI